MLIGLAAVACLVGATVQSAIGFGFALILTPALFAAVDPDRALVTIIIVALLLNAVLLGTERRRPQLMRREIGWMAATALPGLILGALVFAALSKEAIQIAVGVMVVFAAALDARAVLPGLRAGAGHQAVPLGAAAPSGLLSGFLTTTTTANGPPIVLLLRARGASPSQLRDSNAFMLLLLGVPALAATAILGAGLSIDPALTLGLAALAVGGQLAGRRVFARLDGKRFHSAGLAIILVAGLMSLSAGLLALLGVG
ncbi:sulfite exporter TauE/SafE family protein [Thermoleophilia bacterium SCSIO 60948]|nr:sulfite exporter TauE/SafE family protein [Thermoleophilia bacterium SCSIO 60948]